MAPAKADALPENPLEGGDLRAVAGRLLAEPA
jgi:hypothetical protein